MGLQPEVINCKGMIDAIRKSAGIRLFVLFGSFFILLLLSSLISVIIDSIPIGSVRDKHLWGSFFQCVLAFCLPAFCVAIFSDKHPFRWLKLEIGCTIKSLIGVIIVYLITLPGMEWIIQWNSSVHFPESMAGFEEMLRAWEDTGNDFTQNMLNVTGFMPVLVGVLIIGVLTGFSEELFFRGGMQGIFARTSIGKTMAVILTGFVFSFMHFQFFGFIPRSLMGIFFGYLVVWTDSLWPSVFAHSLNNSVIVILAGLGVENTDTTISDMTNLGSVLPIASIVVTALFFIFFRRFFFSNLNKNNSYGENDISR